MYCLIPFILLKVTAANILIWVNVLVLQPVRACYNDVTRWNHSFREVKMVISLNKATSLAEEMKKWNEMMQTVISIFFIKLYMRQLCVGWHWIPHMRTHCEPKKIILERQCFSMGMRCEHQLDFWTGFWNHSPLYIFQNVKMLLNLNTSVIVMFCLSYSSIFFSL